MAALAVVLAVLAVGMAVLALGAAVWLWWLPVPSRVVTNKTLPDQGPDQGEFWLVTSRLELFPVRESLVSDIPAGNGKKIANLFYSVPMNYLLVLAYIWHV
jgi:hypothetical protein